MGSQVQLSKYLRLSGRHCGTCEAEPAAVHCRTCPGGGAFLCRYCDARIHAGAREHMHARVWVCQVCEVAPAAVTCKADAAVLCASCDADIHEANPLARRHVRVPVAPIGPVSAAFGAAAEALLFDAPDEGYIGGKQQLPVDMNLNLDAKVSDADLVGEKRMKLDYFSSDLDTYLNLEYARLAQTDGVVPAAAVGVGGGGGGGGGGFEIDFGKVKTSYSSYTANSLSHSVSSSEIGVAPEAIGRGGGGSNTIEIDFTMSKPGYMSYTANSLSHSGYSSSDAGVVPEENPSVFVRSVAMTKGREARLMRYREKRKNRRFEKTVRYASRKAYAETRPRIKGRFTKRTDADANANAEVDVDDQMAVPGFMLDFGYGVVPSF